MIKTLALTCFMLTLSCGTNSYSEFETADPAEEAVKELEQDNPGKAIEILETALAGDPNNQQYLGLLGAAYAQKGEVDMLRFAESFLSGEGGGGSGVTSTFGVLPDATSANISNLDTAVTYLSSIPAGSRTIAESFQLSIFLSASVSLRTKAFDSDGDGNISAEEVAAMSVTQALDLLTSIDNAAAIVAASGTQDGTDNDKLASQLTDMQTSINAAPGETSDARLKNYLSNQTSTE